MIDRTTRVTTREDVLTVEQAAAELGVSAGVVYANVKAGVIPKLPLKGRLVLLPRTKFEQFKRGELDETGEPRQRPTERQQDLLRGVKSIIQRWS
jgi:excisionase family DNA binding protein